MLLTATHLAIQLLCHLLERGQLMWELSDAVRGGGNAHGSAEQPAKQAFCLHSTILQLCDRAGQTDLFPLDHLGSERGAHHVNRSLASFPPVFSCEGDPAQPGRPAHLLADYANSEAHRCRDGAVCESQL